jgi:parvulin-like peptidyl-prolyl isomerase
MSTLTREILVLGLASLSAFLLLGCGGAAKPRSASKSAERISAQQKAQGEEHPIDMIPPPVRSADEAKTVARVGAVAISGATYAHWAKVLTPKIASYEPRSRFECSSKKARAGVVAAMHRETLPPALSKLSPAKLQALCVRLKQASVRESVLQQLISYQWVIGEAGELGAGVGEAEVRHSLARELSDKQTAAELKRTYIATGQTLGDARLALRLQIATQNIFSVIKRKVSERFTPAAVERYYREHLKELSIPETREIRGVRTWTRAAIAKAIAEVRAGKDIAGVAKRVSIDKPSGENGGLIQGIVKGQQEKGLDEAIFAAKPHTLTGPLHLRGRYWAFEVVKVVPGRTKTLAEVKAAVRQKLSEELLAQERARFIRAFRKKWLARTSCAPGYLVSRCKEWRGRSVLVSEDPYEVK